MFQPADAGRAGGADFLSAGQVAATGLRFQLLGDFRVRAGNHYVESYDWQLRRAKNALKLLVLTDKHRLHREEVMTALWPSLSPEAATNNLHKALYVMRRTLEPDLAPRAASRFILLRGDFVELAGPVETDVDAFIAAAHRALALRHLDVCLAALQFYAGELLPEDRYEDWSMPLREQLSTLRVDVLLLASRLYGEAENLDDAVALAQLAIGADPLNEEAHAHLVLMLSRKGQRHLALQHYRQYQASLRDELGVDPGERAVAVVRQVAGDRMMPPPPRETGSDQRRRSAPLDPLPLFGRDADIARVERLLAEMYRGAGGVVLIDGEPGSGKTSLVTAVASRAAQLGTTVVWLSAGRSPEIAAGTAPGKVLLVADDPEEPIADPVGSFLAGSGRNRVAVLVAHRSDPAAVPKLVDELSTLLPVRCLTLGPLGEDAVELIVQAQLGAQMSADVVTWLQGLAEGNPHFLREGISALVGRQAVHCVNGRWVFSDVPPEIDREKLRHPPGTTEPVD